jgi:hopene-associated glycosyltransferase HpnB
MLDPLTLLSWFACAFWIVLVFDRRRWWPRDHRLDTDSAGTAPPSRDEVVVVIPARDEAETLPLTLPSLLEQGDAFSALVVVDDSSTDGTGGVAHALAAGSAWAEKVRVVRGSPAPPGWSGKLHALATGLAVEEGQEGRPPSGSRWLLFTDADVRHSPRSVPRLLAKGREGPYDLVSVMVRLRCGSFWERLLIPPFVYFFQLLYPFRRVSDPRSRVAAAAGGCILVRESTFRQIGGFREIRGAVIDDVALASRVKAGGGRCWLGTDPDMVSVRAYGSFGEIARMVSRTAFTQLHHSLPLLCAALFFLLAFFVAPPVLAALHLAAGKVIPGFLALAACFIQAATLYPVVSHQRAGALYACTLSVSSLLYAWMTFRSAWLYFRAQGVEWKGRQVG